MMLFQIIVGLLLLTTVSYFVFLRRTALHDKIYVLIFSFVILMFLLFPSLSQKMADVLGVGRGVDLLLYLANLFFLYLLFLYYIRFKSLERKLTILTRELALRNPIGVDRSHDR